MINTALKRLKRYWQIRTGRFDTPIDGDVPFWVISLCIQLLLLGLLTKLLLPSSDFPTDIVFVGEQDDPVELFEPLIPDVEFNDIDIEQLSNNSDVELEIVTQQQTPLIDLASAAEISVDVSVDSIGDLMSETLISEPSEILASVHSAGSVGNIVTGASGAVDRLTQEILRSLEDNATMVVWLFDQSASLDRQRSEIEGRIERIYRELDLLKDAKSTAFEKDEEKPLLTQVYAFGQNVTPVLRKPTDNIDRIKSAIAEIQRDSTGIENVFTAVLRCVRDFSDFSKIIHKTGQRKRNMMFVILSDETGDDGQFADDAIKACEKAAIAVYVIGIPAPFGRPETRVKWVDPDPRFDQRPQVALVSQGPESLMQERLNLNFIGGDFQDLEMIDSGYGPFNLTRLCYQTGGIYFAVHPNRRRGRVSFRETDVYSSDLRYFFDPEVMRKYQPDYVSNNEYKNRANDNQARMSLLQAAAIPETQQLAAPRFRFPKFDEAEFIRNVGEAQRSAAILQPRLDKLYRVLKEGELDREKESALRWQAGFDLAIGRVMAAMLRSKTYNEMLALSKTKMDFKDPKNNTWVLQPSNNLSLTGSQNEKLAERAQMYLNRVVEQHPETPWGMLAQRELTTPLGWKWRETYTKPPEPRQPRQPNNNNNNPRNPQPRQNAMPKQLRPIPKL